MEVEQVPLVDVLSCSPDDFVSESGNSASVSATPASSSDTGNLLLCLEEVESLSGDEFQEGEEEEEACAATVLVPGGGQAAAATADFCNPVPATPSNNSAVMFSPPNGPWLTSSSCSPRITSVFGGSLSPPLQPLYPQATTPRLHHLSPPPSMYSPCIPMPNSPQFLMYNDTPASIM